MAVFSNAAKPSVASTSLKSLLKDAGSNHREDGLTLESDELGSVKITDSFVDSDTARLRLLIKCPANRKGRLPVTLSPFGNIIDSISSRSVLAKEGLLRKGDTVIAADGKALGQTTLEEALSQDTTIHTLIIHRTDPQLTSLVMKAPPSAISGTHAAAFFRVQIDMTHVVGRSDTVRLGINVNTYNGTVYIVPGSPIAQEGMLKIGDVLVELNGQPLGDTWLVDLLDDEPLQGEFITLNFTPAHTPHASSTPSITLIFTLGPAFSSVLALVLAYAPLPPSTPTLRSAGETCTLVAVRLPNMRKDEASRTRAERASRNRGYHPAPSVARKTANGGGSLWDDHRDALALCGGNKHVAALVVAGRKAKLIAASVLIQSAYRSAKARRYLLFHIDMAVRIERRARERGGVLQEHRDLKAANCASSIQAGYKMARERKKFMLLRKATLRIQRKLQANRVLEKMKLADSHNGASMSRRHNIRLARTVGKLGSQLQKTVPARSFQWEGDDFFGDEKDADRASSMSILPHWSDVPLDGKGYNAAFSHTEMSTSADDKDPVCETSPKELALAMLEDTETQNTFAAYAGPDGQATKGMLFEWSLKKLQLMAKAAKHT